MLPHVVQKARLSNAKATSRYAKSRCENATVAESNLSQPAANGDEHVSTTSVKTSSTQINGSINADPGFGTIFSTRDRLFADNAVMGKRMKNAESSSSKNIKERLGSSEFIT